MPAFFTSNSEQDAETLTNGNRLIVIDTNGFGPDRLTRDVEFIVLVENRSLVTRSNPYPEEIIGRRFDANGVALSNEPFTVQIGAGGGFGNSKATLLEDGLVAIAFTSNTVAKSVIVATQALDIVLTDENEDITGTLEDDIIEGAGGADTIDGAGGFDVVSFAGSAQGVALRLADGTGTQGDASGDVYTNIEGLRRDIGRHSNRARD